MQPPFSTNAIIARLKGRLCLAFNQNKTLNMPQTRRSQIIMMKQKILTSLLASAAATVFAASAFAGDVDVSKTVQSGTVEKEHTDTDLFSLDTSYTGESTVRQALPIGKVSWETTDFNYGHRFLIKDKLYLRLGVEYQRYDFFGAVQPLPDHLQGISATVALEYVVQNYAAAAIEFHPGFYFENVANGRTFDVPIDAYVSFPIWKDKNVYGMAGVFTGQNFSPVVAPIGGVIWLINDKLRLQALFPRSALIYTLNDDWELSLNGEIGGYGFHVDQKGRTPSQYSGSRLEYIYERIGGQVKYTAWKNMNVALGAGYNVGTEFDFIHDGPGQKYKGVGAPYVSLSMEVNF
jgi:hypothetical protein